MSGMICISSRLRSSTADSGGYAEPVYRLIVWCWVMRIWAAIFVAVMSVATGGPLRCPCQVKAMFEGMTSLAAVPKPKSEKAPRHPCTCHAHQQEEQHGPNEPRPEPNCPTCPHGPGVDLVPPVAAGERTAGERSFGETTFGYASVSLAATTISLRRSPAFIEPNSSPPEQLRYCHAFRS